MVVDFQLDVCRVQDSSSKHTLSKGFAGCPKGDTRFAGFRVCMYWCFLFLALDYFTGAEHGEFTFAARR